MLPNGRLRYSDVSQLSEIGLFSLLMYSISFFPFMYVKTRRIFLKKNFLVR